MNDITNYISKHKKSLKIDFKNNKEILKIK